MPVECHVITELMSSDLHQLMSALCCFSAVLPTEFGRFANLAEELKVRGGVPQQEIVALQDIFRKELDLKNRPRQELLPHLVVRPLVIYALLCYALLWGLQWPPVGVAFLIA